MSRGRNDKQARRVLTEQMDAVESELRRKKYEQERDAYKSSEKGLMEAKIRGLAQKATFAEDEANKILLNATLELKNNIAKSLIELLGLDKNSKKEVSTEEIKNAMKLLIVPLAKLKSMCEKYDLKATKNAKYSIYETLFNELIENVDVRLVVFAPKESVLRRDYPFTKFPNELKNEMLKHVEKLEIQKQFMKLYGKFFEKTEDLSL